MDQLVTLKISDLKPYEKNARKHETADVAAIAKSIEAFGFNDPVGVWGPQNIIVEGHGRVLAAKQLGLTEVPCIRLDDLSDEERRAYGLAHNKTAELSTWDAELLPAELKDIRSYDMEAFGFIPPAEIGVEDHFQDPDLLPEDAEPRTRRGDIYIYAASIGLCAGTARIRRTWPGLWVRIMQIYGSPIHRITSAWDGTCVRVRQNNFGAGPMD